MHRNDQFFRWTLSAVSLCKIMDTVRYPLHPAPQLLKEHYGSICKELELNWSFLLLILLSHFQSRELQSCYKQAGCYISPGHHVAATKLQSLVFFSSNFVAIFMLCSSVARLKRNMIILSGSKSLFLHWFCL